MAVSYTEDYVLAAYRKVWGTNFLTSFKKALHKEEELVLFTKDELLAVTATERDKLMVHGIFAVFGTVSANEPALMDKARKANLGGNMEIMIRLAKARKEEDFQPGDVVRDADGICRELCGNRMWATFRNPLLTHYDEPKRPLEKI